MASIPETGWDLGPFAAVLAPGYTSSNKIQGNYVGLKITACMQQLGQILDKR